jgi:hypothetical protein
MVSGAALCASFCNAGAAGDPLFRLSLRLDRPVLRPHGARSSGCRTADNQSPDDESAKITELRRKFEALALKMIEALAPKAAKEPAPRAFSPRAMEFQGFGSSPAIRCRSRPISTPVQRAPPGLGTAADSRSFAWRN